jgi:hypothetical protein
MALDATKGRVSLDEPAGRSDHPTDPTDPTEVADLADLALALSEVGRRVRDAVRSGVVGGLGHDGLGEDHLVVRTEGGDDVFGIDVRAERALLAGLEDVGRRWPGLLVVEGFDDSVPVGDANGPWRFIADPVDGTRGLLAGKRSAWVLLGAGRHAETLEGLEVGALVEIPTRRAAVGLVAWAVQGGAPVAVDDDLTGAGRAPEPVTLTPRGGDLARRFVTVVRLAPGSHAPIGAWADQHLAGLEVYDDLAPCTGGYLAGLASGADAAVFDPRPLLVPGHLCAHPYDLAALVVARAAGAVVEALPPGRLDVPLDCTTDVAWAGYADDEMARRLRPEASTLVR